MNFFLGCSRTASKMYQYNLNKFTHLNISDELKLLNIIPFYNSLLYFYLKCKILRRNNTQLSNEVYTKLRGTFWKKRSIKKNEFVEILNNNTTFKAIICGILEKDAQNKNKKVCGGKFPIYIAYFSIFKWLFPKSNFIFLVRNPNDIYLSQLNKHAIKSPINKLLMIIYVSLMFNFTYYYISRYKYHDKVHFIKYENMCENKESVLLSLCHFLKIEYQEVMANPPVIESSVGRGNSEEQNDIIKPSKWEKNTLKILNYLPLSKYYDL